MGTLTLELGTKAAPAMGGEPAGIFLNKKRGSRERYCSPNQLNRFNQVNQVKKEIEIVSILKGLQFFSRALGPMQFHLPLRAANAL